MTKGFWEKLKKPIMALAPMADVTDAAFRRIIAKYSKWGGEDVIDESGKFIRPGALSLGGLDVMWTEFVSADGLFLADEIGKAKLMRDLIFSDAERPIVAQFFTARPDMMEKAATLAVELGFDGIDINMGCPDRSIEKQGAGAAMIKNPKLAREIIKAAKRGAMSVKRRIPVSIKTRIGFNKNELETWLPEILAEEPAAITIHARTRKEMSKIPAQWEKILRAVQIRNKMKSKTLILGNGDVIDLIDAKKKVEKTGCDGVMLGRAIFGNPWLFTEKIPTIEEKLRVMVLHTRLFEKLFRDIKPRNEFSDGVSARNEIRKSTAWKNFAIMKKHFKAYVNGWPGAKELRQKLMETVEANEVEKNVTEYLLRAKLEAGKLA